MSHKHSDPDVEEKYSQETPDGDEYMSSDQISVTAKYRGKVNEQDPPLLAHFPHGVPFPLTDSDVSQLPIHMFLHTDTSKPHRILTCHTDDVEYVAKNWGEDDYKNQPVKYVIGLFDSTRNTLKLMETPHLYSFHQHLLTRDTSHRDTQQPQTSYADARDTLIETFGSRKRKRQLKAQAANQVQLETSTSDMLMHVLDQDVEPLQSEADTIAAIKAAILPKYHADATDVKDVYRLEDMLSPDEIATLDPKPYLKLIKKPSWSQSDKDSIPQFIQHILNNVIKRVGNDKERQREIIQIVMFLQLLVEWMLTNRKFKYKGLMQLNCSELIKERLQTDFMESKTMAGQTRSEFSSTSETKLYCHIMVLSLMACSYVIDEYALELISGWLKINVTDALGYYREIGCGSATRQGVKLTLPLRFVPFRKAKKSKDKK